MDDSEDPTKLFKPDDFDYKIMKLLQVDAGMRDGEIGQKIGLDRSSVNRRIKKLQSNKYILGFNALLNRKKLDLGYLVITMIMLENHSQGEMEEFEKEIKKSPYILQWWLLHGSWDYMLISVTRDQDHYEELYNSLRRCKNVRRSRGYPPVFTSSVSPLPLPNK